MRLPSGYTSGHDSPETGIRGRNGGEGKGRCLRAGKGETGREQGKGNGGREEGQEEGKEEGEKGNELQM